MANNNYAISVSIGAAAIQIECAYWGPCACVHSNLHNQGGTFSLHTHRGKMSGDITHTPSWRKLGHWLLFYRRQKLKSKLKVFPWPLHSICVCGFVLITSRATVLSHITQSPASYTL